MFKIQLLLLLIAAVATHGRPEGDPKKAETKREGKSQTVSSAPVDSASLPMEARSGSSGLQKLSYYGGALGRFLLIEPDGKMKIIGDRRPPSGPREDEPEEEGPANESEGYSDTISISKPPENASIAEAKPVAVSIAGHGGMASAQPVATAVVGPHGLAIARPIATAIAGIEGAEELVPHKRPPGEEPIQHRKASDQNKLVYGAFPPQTILYYSVPVY